MLKKALHAAVSLNSKDSRSNEAVYFVWVSQLVEWMNKSQESHGDITAGFYKGNFFECKLNYEFWERVPMWLSFSLIILTLLFYVIILVYKRRNNSHGEAAGSQVPDQHRHRFGDGEPKPRLPLFGKIVTAGFLTPKGTMRRATVAVLWIVWRLAILAAMLVGPCQIWLDGNSTPEVWTTKRGCAFRYLLAGQTAGVCIYWLLSLLTSLGIQIGLETLTTHLEKQKQDRGRVVNTWSWIPRIIVAAAFLVSISTIGVAMTEK